jgi:hypothetical protein
MGPLGFNADQAMRRNSVAPLKAKRAEAKSRPTTPRPLPPFMSAVVCPLVARELPIALRNFEIWTKLGMTAPSKSHTRPLLVYSFNCAETPSFTKALRDAFNKHPVVRACFTGIEVRFCNLPPEKDVYIRSATSRKLPFGYKAGPNWQFYETLKGFKGKGKFIFLMEVDCEPVEPNWLQQLEEVCARNANAWIIGSHYRGVSPLHWSVARHINGNALYNAGDRAFLSFLDEILWPWMHEHIQNNDPTLAYDCAWETFLNRQEMEDPSNYDWIVSRGALHRFRICNAIVNIGGTAEQIGDYIWTKEEVIARYPGAVVVHGPLTNSAEHYRDRIALGIPKASGSFVMENRHLRCAGAIEGAQIARTFWLPGKPFTADMNLHFSISVRCPRHQGVRIALSDRNGQFIDMIKWLQEGDKSSACRVSLTHAIAARHAYMRLIVLPIARANEAVDIRCDLGSLEITSAGSRIAAAKSFFEGRLRATDSKVPVVEVPETWLQESLRTGNLLEQPTNALATVVGQKPISLTTVRLDEYHSSENYSCLDVSLLLVAYGEDFWPQIKFKFGVTANGHELEFRQGPGWPVIFVDWRPSDKDKYGSVLRLRDDDELVGKMQLWQGARDRKLLQLISALLPEIVSRAAALNGCSEADVTKWKTQADTMSQRLLTALPAIAV